MKTWNSTFTLSNTNFNYTSFFPEDALFFDIETTGFSTNHSICYLIGCASRKGDQITITQYFADQATDEKKILECFFSYLANFKTLISFHGTGFDIPFLQKRSHIHSMNIDFAIYHQIDIFKEFCQLKPLLNLPDYKQKTFEHFLAIERKDEYNGGELISVYKEYQKNQNADALSILKLHNYDDICGMISLLPMFSYIHFFRGNFHIGKIEQNLFKNYDGRQTSELIFSLVCDLPFPKHLSCRKDGIYLILEEKTAHCSIPIYSGELKHFYKNYKDYYYLPKEDMAIHKSIAFYVDKKYRTQAKASNCYTKKTGYFLPQYENRIIPYFKLKYNAPISYFEYPESFSVSDSDAKNYCMHILSHLLNNKKLL